VFLPALLSVVLLTNAPETAIQLEVRHRVVAVDPSGNRALYAPAAAAFREKTRIELLEPEAVKLDPKRIAACPNKQRFQCWVKVVFELPQRPEYLLVLGSEKLKNETRMTALFVDLALAKVGTSEDVILEKAVEAVAGIARSSSPADLRFFFDYLIAEKLASRLAQKQEVPPYGWLEIENTPANLLVFVDGVQVGKTSAPRTTIDGLTRDRYAVQVRDQGSRAVYFEGEILPLSGRPVRVTAASVPEIPQRTAVHEVAFWSGSAVFAAGAILTTYAIAASPRAVPFRLCHGACEAGEPGDRFTTFSDVGREPGYAAELGGLSMAPLGAALLGAGAVWSVGALLADPERAPWIELLLGAVLGGATFTTMLVLD
jgi:hypothetical protein